MKVAWLILGVVLCSCSPTLDHPSGLVRVGDVVYTSFGEEPFTKSEWALSPPEHLFHARKALLEDRFALAEAHAQVALHKDPYSLEARQILQILHGLSRG